MKMQLGFLSIFIILLFLESSHGYSLNGYKWSKSKFEYYINPSNADVTEQATIAAIRKGASVWKPWCSAVYKGETTEKIIRNNGMNTVFFRSREYGAVASTYIFHIGEEVLDFDIVFWDVWKFYPGMSGCADGFYIADVASHEFGHVIGLGHSRLKVATMFRRAPLCNNKGRSLEQDDKSGATELYGIPSL